MKMKAPTLEQVNKARSEYRFLEGIGHIHLGEPQMPKYPIFDNCDPPSIIADGTIHFLNPPVERGAPPVPMRWHAATKEWESLRRSAGNRVAFKSAYLGAHGWRYMAQAPVLDAVKWHVKSKERFEGTLPHTYITKEE